MRHIHFEFTIWDNQKSVEDKQEILLYCEHAIRKTLSYYFNPPHSYKIINRFWGGFDAEIEYDDTVWEVRYFLRNFNRRLMRLHYWNRNDEPLEWNYEIR